MNTNFEEKELRWSAAGPTSFWRQVCAPMVGGFVLAWVPTHVSVANKG
jgi:hypothetical protein